MKTKFIWTAMCLPLAFAACTNEEVFVQDNLAVLEGKKAVELKVAATYGTEGAESRMVNNNGTFLWDNTDVLGAVWNEDGKIYSNNKFVNTLTQASEEADFTTDATTVVGSYVFYYPYNTDVTKNLTSGIVYSLPNPQEYDPTGEKMMNNNFMISPNVTVDGNEPGELTLPLTLRSIYGFGKLNIKLHNNLQDRYGNSINSVKIQKIVIDYTSNILAKDGKIDVNNEKYPKVDLSADYIKSLIEGVDGTALEKSCKGKTEAEVRAILFDAADKALTAENKEDYSKGEILDLTGTVTDNTIKQVAISCLTEENPSGIALAKNGTFSTRVLLPTTANAGTTDYIVTIYTDKGYFVYDDLNNSKVRIKASHTINLSNPNHDENGDDEILISALIELTNSFTAVSEADFIANIKQFVKGDEVAVTTTGFDITPAAINAIPEGVKVNFANVVTFAGDMTLKNVKFIGNANGNGTAVNVFKSGNIVLESVYATNVNTKFQINKDAVVTLKAYDTAPNKVSVKVDGGAAIFEKYDEDSKPVLQDNIYKVEVINGGVVDVRTPITVNNEFVLTKGTLGNGSTINGTVTVAGDGIVNNSGTITVANAGTVNNYSVLEGTNTNTINQMSEDAKATLTTNNGGVVNTVAYSETTVTNNDGGEVIFVANARVKATGGAVTYEAPTDIKATDFSALSTSITKIVFTADFTYNYNTAEPDETSLVTLPSTLKHFVFEGNLTLGQAWALNSGSTIQFIGAKANITGAKALTNVTTIKAGVADSAATTDVDESVATKLYIGTGTSIKTLTDVVLVSDATVWNDGTVEYDSSSISTKPTNWEGNW